MKVSSTAPMPRHRKNKNSDRLRAAQQVFRKRPGVKSEIATNKMYTERSRIGWSLAEHQPKYPAASEAPRLALSQGNAESIPICGEKQVMWRPRQ